MSLFAGLAGGLGGIGGGGKTSSRVSSVTGDTSFSFNNAQTSPALIVVGVVAAAALLGVIYVAAKKGPAK